MDPKELLLRHFEKLIAAVCAAVLIYCGVQFVALKPKEMTANEVLEEGLKKIDNHEKNFEVHLEPLVDNTKDLRHQLDPGEVPNADGFGAWLFHRRPSFIYTMAGVKPKAFPRHEPPIEFKVGEKIRKKVSLTWKPNPENQFIKIRGYDIFRKEGVSTADFKQIDSVNGEKNDYVDTSVGPRTKYWYRLVEHAETDRDDPVIVHDKTELDPKRADLNAEDIADAVELPQDKYITIDSGQKPDPGTNTPGLIDIKIYAWHPGSGQFVAKGYRGVGESKKPGALEEKFMIPTTKKPEKVDFSTDATVEEIGEGMHKPVGVTGAVEIKRIYAKVRWPWMGPNDEPETIWEKDLPPEIQAQLKKGKP